MQIETHGMASGHCAYLGIIRGSGTVVSAAEEMAIVRLLRSIAVVSICNMLAEDPRCDACSAPLPATAVISAAGCTYLTPALVPCVVDVLPSLRLAMEAETDSGDLVGYLHEQLGMRAVASSSYGGRLEIGEIGKALGVTVLVLVEEGSRDTGAAAAAAGCCCCCRAPPPLCPLTLSRCALVAVAPLLVVPPPLGRRALRVRVAGQQARRRRGIQADRARQHTSPGVCCVVTVSSRACRWCTHRALTVAR
jgi:hypothetical protein